MVIVVTVMVEGGQVSFSEQCKWKRGGDVYYDEDRAGD